jgi:signal transduction histidine kinase
MEAFIRDKDRCIDLGLDRPSGQSGFAYADTFLSSILLNERRMTMHGPLKLTAFKKLAGAGLIVLFLVAGAGIILKVTVDSLLYWDASAAAESWAKYVAENVIDIEDIAEGRQASAESMAFFIRTQQIRNIFSFEIINLRGNVKLISDGSKVSSISGDVHRFSAAQAAALGHPIISIKEGIPPLRPKIYSEAYLPVIVDGHPQAIVGACVDLSAQYEHFRHAFLISALALSMLIGGAAGIPATAWYHRTKEKQRAERREFELILQKERAEQANEAKSEFLSNVSHELRTPMHAILSYSKLGLTRAANEDPKKTEKYFRNINISGQRLLALLNNLLDLAKLESGKMNFDFEADDFKDVVEQALMELEPLQKEKEIQTSIEITTECTRTVCDKYRMVQVMVNLISNAIKFSPTGSNIVIVLSDGRLSSGGKALRCSVSDEGKGIPENELETVFDKFVQGSKTKTGAGGTGLGLSICREIVEAHGGAIWAQRREPLGSVLNFTIARASSKARGDLPRNTAP